MAKKHLGQVRLTSWRMAPCTTTAVPTWAFIDWLSPKSYVLPKHFFSRPNPDTLKFWTLLYEILVLGQLRGRVSSKLSSAEWHNIHGNFNKRLMAKLPNLPPHFHKLPPMNVKDPFILSMKKSEGFSKGLKRILLFNWIFNFCSDFLNFGGKTKVPLMRSKANVFIDLLLKK